MKPALALALLFAGTVAAADPGSAPEEYLAAAEGDIVVAEDGSVASVDVRTRIGLDVVGPVEKMISTWRFKPGEPGAGERRMAMNLLLAARMWPEEDRIQLGIQAADFRAWPGPPNAATQRRDGKRPDGVVMKPPAYPRDIRGRPSHARLALLVHRGEDGRVDDIELVQGWHMSPEPVPDARVAQWQAAMMAEVEKVAREWVIPGYGDGNCLLVPVTFRAMTRLWDRAQSMEPAPLRGPCAKELGHGELKVMGELEPVEPISKLLPEVWASVAAE